MIESWIEQRTDVSKYEIKGFQKQADTGLHQLQSYAIFTYLRILESSYTMGTKVYPDTEMQTTVIRHKWNDAWNEMKSIQEECIGLESRP